MKQRNSSVELLRFFFMFAVVLLHTIGWGSNGNDKLMERTVLISILENIGKIGVTGFMFITGFYGIKINISKILRLLSLVAFWFLVTDSIVYYYNNGVFSILHGFNGWYINLFIRAFDQYWFITCYLVVCFIAPLLEHGIENVDKKTFKLVVCALFLYTYLAHFVGMQNERSVSFLLTIYLCARYIRIYPMRLINDYPLILGLCSLIVFCVLPIIVDTLHLPESINKMFVSNNNPLLLIAAAGFVIKADGFKFSNSVINYFMSSVLAIYLITDFGDMHATLDV